MRDPLLLWSWVMDRFWEFPRDSEDYVIVMDPASPEPGHWEHDA